MGWDDAVHHEMAGANTEVAADERDKTVHGAAVAEVGLVFTETVDAKAKVGE